VREGGPDPVLIHRVIARLNVGGPAMHVVNLASGLDGEGEFRTRLIAGSITGDEGDMGYYAQERGVEVLELPALSRLVSPLNDLRILWSLYSLFRRERPTIVHTHTAKAGTLGRIAAFLAGVPIRIHTFHGHVLGGDYFSPYVTRFYLEVERQLARVSNRLVVLTHGQKREMAEELRVGPREKFSVIPLGLELGRFSEVDREGTRHATRTALGIPEEEIVVGIVGRLVPVKNHELLFRAQPILEQRLKRPVRILVVGSGLREGELKGYVRKLGIEDSVQWLGWRQDLPELYSAMDAFALTSFDEGTPVAVLEALASGTPVAARDVGGVAEILEGVPLTTLIREPTEEAVAAALTTVLGLELSGKALQEVRQSTAERFSVVRLAGEMEGLYREELEKRTGNGIRSH
jgi:glycosyltransferase involved in cell wall biosynthesis